MPDIERIEFTECEVRSKYEGKYMLIIVLEESGFEYDFIVKPTFLKDILEPGDVVIPCLCTTTDTITKSSESITIRYSQTRFTLQLEDFMVYLLLV